MLDSWRSNPWRAENCTNLLACVGMLEYTQQHWESFQAKAHAETPNHPRNWYTCAWLYVIGMSFSIALYMLLDIAIAMHYHFTGMLPTWQWLSHCLQFAILLFAFYLSLVTTHLQTHAEQFVKSSPNCCYFDPTKVKHNTIPEIWLTAGTYYVDQGCDPEVTAPIDQLELNYPITIRGAGMGKTFLSGGISSTYVEGLSYNPRTLGTKKTKRIIIEDMTLQSLKYRAAPSQLGRGYQGFGMLTMLPTLLRRVEVKDFYRSGIVAKWSRFEAKDCVVHHNGEHGLLVHFTTAVLDNVRCENNGYLVQPVVLKQGCNMCVAFGVVYLSGTNSCMKNTQISRVECVCCDVTHDVSSVDIALEGGQDELSRFKDATSKADDKKVWDDIKAAYPTAYPGCRVASLYLAAPLTFEDIGDRFQGNGRFYGRASNDCEDTDVLFMTVKKRMPLRRF